MRILSKVHSFFNEKGDGYILNSEIKFIRFYEVMNIDKHELDCMYIDSDIGAPGCYCPDIIWEIDGANEYGYSEDMKTFFYPEQLEANLIEFCDLVKISNNLRIVQIQDPYTLHPEE